MLVMYFFAIAILFQSIWQYRIRKKFITCRGEMNVCVVGLRRWNADIVMLVLHISIYLYAFIAIYGSDLKWNAFFCMNCIHNIGRFKNWHSNDMSIARVRVSEFSYLHIVILPNADEVAQSQ